MPPVCAPPLAPSARVAICAPSGPVTPEAFKPGLEVLASRYRVTVSEDLTTRRNDYLAGSDQQRADELMRAMGDPDIRAIFCARGGYGAARILEFLDADALRRDPKPICGFSDVTTLLHFWLNADVVPVHGPVVTQLGRLDPASVAHLFRLLEDPDYRPAYTGTPWLARHAATVQVHGRTAGGNLAVLASLAGTGVIDYVADTLLLLEDVAEPPYKVDRMFTQLGQCGFMENVAGVALGELTSHDPTTGSSDTEKDSAAVHRVAADRLTRFGVPAVRRMPWGHGKQMLAVALGVPGILDLAAGSLQIDGPAVDRP